MSANTCAQCGKSLAGRTDAIYCSSACRQRAYRERKDPVAVTPPVTATPVVDILDVEIAALWESMRRIAWMFAAFSWADGHEGQQIRIRERAKAALIYVWQHAIDTGHVQPVTSITDDFDFDIPDLSWPGLGLDERDEQRWDMWDIFEDFEQLGVDYAARRELERRWVKRDLRRQADEQADAIKALITAEVEKALDKAFDRDGNFVVDTCHFVNIDRSVKLAPSEPSFFDDLIFKTDDAALQALADDD